ncbi:hypothetical protein DAPPUDRAFT_111797 [Daphnia pulex]|uniref:Uncharacterized protein n=1 Tax=Daphnia pulex TaxID=6669 RepID=E9HA54_DAPPU|nr:hypothetical protein DAPPUDRAFT_111797 [Daphnia pulex]|eukprot:EFX71408.1 hypothetical protein DAPPUDRAFT_111797 [Daphnia pulex]
MATIYAAIFRAHLKLISEKDIAETYDSTDKLPADVFQRAPTERMSYPADDISHDPDEEDTDIYVDAVDTSDEPTPDSELGETANGNNSQNKNLNELPVIFPFKKNIVVELAGLTKPVIQEETLITISNENILSEALSQYHVTDAQLEIISILKLISSLENNPAARQRLFNLLLSKAGQLIRSNPNSFGNLRGINSRSKLGLISPSSI